MSCNCDKPKFNNQSYRIYNCANGWIVNPYGHSGNYTSSGDVYVFGTKADLANWLKKTLEE